MAKKLPGLQRVLDVPSLAAVAYGEIASSLYFALGVIALYALGFTPWVLLAVGLLFLVVALSYAEVGRPRDAGPLQDKELGRVAELDAVLELLLESLEAVTPLLDQRHLVPEVEDAFRQIGADLATAGDEDVHLAPLQAIHACFSPAITLRQSRPSTLPRLPSLGAAECALWLGAHDREAGQHHLKGR